MTSKVMIIDKDPGILDATSEVLKSYGFTVFPLRQAENIANEVINNQPHLILLDVSNFENELNQLIEKIREITRSSIPVLLFSTRNDLEQITRRIGVAGFINKPFDCDLLINKITGCLKK